MATVDATTQKVQRILLQEFGDVSLTNSGFKIEHGSTAIIVRIDEWAADSDGNPRSVVHVWAPVARDVKPTPDLYRWAATEGQHKLFGGVTVIDGQDGKSLVTYDTTLLGDYVDPEELTTAVYAVGFTADELDDLVRERFGGERYVD